MKLHALNDEINLLLPGKAGILAENLLVVLEIFLKHFFILAAKKLSRPGQIRFESFLCLGMLGYHEGIKARRREQQCHAGIFWPILISQFIGAIDKGVDHLPVENINLFFANCLVAHDSIIV